MCKKVYLFSPAVMFVMPASLFKFHLSQWVGTDWPMFLRNASKPLLGIQSRVVVSRYFFIFGCPEIDWKVGTINQMTTILELNQIWSVSEDGIDYLCHLIRLLYKQMHSSWHLLFIMTWEDNKFVYFSKFACNSRTTL